MQKLPDIYQYFDYRKYIRDCYEALRGQNARFSYRFIHKKTGIDPDYMVKVFNNQKNLTEQAVPGFARLFKLSKRITRYFTILILFGRAKSGSEIKHYFEQLLSFKELSAKNVDADAYEYYNRW